MKLSFTLFGLVGLLTLVGCGGGKAPSAEDAAKIKLGMTMTEVEAILGSGKEVSAPPGGGGGPAQTYEPPTKIWKQWGGETAGLWVHFNNGKATAVTQRNLNMANPTPPPSAPGAPANPSATSFPPAKLDPSFKQLHESTGYQTPLLDLGGILSINFSQQMAPNAAALGKDYRLILEQTRAYIESGEIVVLWGAKPGAKVRAYPKIALERPAYFLNAKGDAEKCTPGDLKALLEAQK